MSDTAYLGNHHEHINKGEAPKKVLPERGTVVDAKTIELGALQFQIKTDGFAKGDKVKFTIKFKGRELQHSNLGDELMQKIKTDMEKLGKVELQPKFDGKQMIMIIQPI